MDLARVHLPDVALWHRLPSNLKNAASLPSLYSQPAVPIYLGLLCLSLILLNARKQIYLLARFAYSCFLAPIGNSHEQKDRLNTFYKTQSEIYDATRARLLRGREDMLQLTAAHLREQMKEAKAAGRSKKLVWVDIGGGTGWNIEKMDEYFSIDDFHAVFLIDLCEPLLEVARKRFAAKGWKNVHVLCQDASAFVLPDLPGIDGLSLCTLSYSLSMIPNFYGLLDRIERFLDPSEGIVGCVDFYVSGRSAQTVMNAGDTRRHCSWWNRVFWQHWFEWDHVELHPSRRNYLEFRFGTIKSINARNEFGIFASIPYYVWIGCKAKRDLASRLTIFGHDPLTPMLSPTLTTSNSANSFENIPDLSLSPSFSASREMTALAGTQLAPNPERVDIPFESTGSALSAFYYQKHNYRMPYIHGDDQKQFRSFIYGFTWEDPYDDMRRMKIGKKDTVLCITSAGDNALHYAIAGQPKRIHCVDMNPCQGHLLELKLACIHALEFEDFWKIFGEGRHPSFAKLLDERIGPHLSAHAYNFWKVNSRDFDDRFYLRGYSGWALRILNMIFRIRGQSKWLEAFANADSLDEQRKIYDAHIRPVLLSNSFVKLILSNPVFLWNSLGVPMNQLKMLTNETSVRQYCIDTLDPIGRGVHVKNENYHYYLTVTGRFNPDNPPLYLTREGFEALKAANCSSLESFRLHTDSLFNVIRSMEPGSLDVCIIMDSTDWLSSTDPIQLNELRTTIRAYRKALSVGGRVYWRSSAMNPWYAEVWATEGFRTERLSVRSIGANKPIDTVNMYASLWRAVKM